MKRYIALAPPHAPSYADLLPLCTQLGDTLNEFLLEATQDVKLRVLVTSLSECIRTIAYKVRRHLRL